MEHPRTHGIDPLSGPVEKHFAVVYAPGKKRARFAENCVEVLASADAALHQADPAGSRFPALIYGPSSSSEGLKLYYLIEWLEC